MSDLGEIIERLEKTIRSNKSFYDTMVDVRLAVNDLKEIEKENSENNGGKDDN